MAMLSFPSNVPFFSIGHLNLLTIFIQSKLLTPSTSFLLVSHSPVFLISGSYIHQLLLLLFPWFSGLVVSLSLISPLNLVAFPPPPFSTSTFSSGQSLPCPLLRLPFLCRPLCHVNHLYFEIHESWISFCRFCPAHVWWTKHFMTVWSYADFIYSQEAKVTPM